MITDRTRSHITSVFCIHDTVPLTSDNIIISATFAWKIEFMTLVTHRNFRNWHPNIISITKDPCVQFFLVNYCNVHDTLQLWMGHFTIFIVCLERRFVQPENEQKPFHNPTDFRFVIFYSCPVYILHCFIANLIVSRNTVFKMFLFQIFTYVYYIFYNDVFVTIIIIYQVMIFLIIFWQFLFY